MYSKLESLQEFTSINIMELKWGQSYSSVVCVNDNGLKEKHWNNAVTFAREWPATHKIKDGKRVLASTSKVIKSDFFIT